MWVARSSRVYKYCLYQLQIQFMPFGKIQVNFFPVILIKAQKEGPEEYHCTFSKHISKCKIWTFLLFVTVIFLKVNSFNKFDYVSRCAQLVWEMTKYFCPNGMVEGQVVPKKSTQDLWSLSSGMNGFW